LKFSRNILKFKRIIFSTTLSIYFTISILFFSSLIFPTSLAVDEEPDELTDSNMESIGVVWKYIRSDNDPEGNATSWKLRWSPDGKWLAVVYFDDTTIILDSETGDLVTALGSGGKAILDAESAEKDDEKIGETSINSQTKSSRCWGFTINPLAPLLRACAWSPDNKYIAVAGDHRKIEIFETSSWDSFTVLEGHTGSILSLDWSPDGTRIASGEGTDQVLPHNQGTVKYNIKIWNITTGTEIHTLLGHKDSVVSLSWSQNSSRLASASDDRDIRIWDTENGKLLDLLGEGLGHSAGVLDVGWSPNQTRLISGSRDFKVRLWDVESGLPIGKPWKDHNCVRSTQWHPTGRYILSAGVDQTIKIRDSATGRELMVFTEAEATNSEVMSARWSPDGLKFAACSSRGATVRLYGFGGAQPDSDQSDDFSYIGIPLFFIIGIIGVTLIFLPLINEFRHHRK